MGEDRMDDQLAQVIGMRLQAARAANRKTRVVVAGLTGITSDYLYQIECGKKLPTLTVLTRLAAVLNVPPSRLLDESQARAGDRTSMTETGTALYRALTQPVAPYEPPPVAELHDHIRSAWRIWQTSPYRYSKVSHRLPTLVTDTELSLRHDTSGGERRAAQCCAADLYTLLRTVTKRLGQVDLSLLAADRAIRAADLADDPHRLAAARWNLAHVLLADHQTEGAEDVAMQAADAIHPLMKAGDLDAAA